MLTRVFRPSHWLAGWLALTCTVPVVATAAGPGPVVISELMWAGSTASSADEWIELYNRGSEPVDLVGWTITRGDGDDEKTMLQIDAGMLMPGEVFLISNYDHDDERSRLASVPALVDPVVSLPNTKLRLRLYDGLPETGTIIDEADDGTGAPFGGQGGDTKAAMVRTDLDAPGDSKNAWTTAVESSGWDPGATELGTPGSVAGGAGPKLDDQTQVSAVRWAEIKASRR